MVEFGAELRWTFVMAGLERDLLGGRSRAAALDDSSAGRLIKDWLRAAGVSGAPLDPLIWAGAPPASSQPACMAVKAAFAQSPERGQHYLRLVREGLMCHRRRLDGVDSLVEVADEAGLDPRRFEVDLRSHATTEEFGADLERTRALAEGGKVVEFASDAGGASLPSLVFSGDGGEHVVAGLRDYEDYQQAAVAAGAESGDAGSLTIDEAIARFGSATTVEVAELCDLPGPRAAAALFKLAEQWKLRPQWCMTGYLWSAA